MSRVQRWVGSAAIGLHIVVALAVLTVAGARGGAAAAFAPLAGAGSVVLALLLWAHLRRPWTSRCRCVLLFVASLVVAGTLPEPFVSRQMSLLVLAPPLLVPIVGSGPGVLVCFAVEMVVLLGRAGGGGVYSHPSTWAALLFIVVAAVLARFTLDSALREAKKKAADLEAQAARFRALMEEAGDLIAVVGPDGVVHSVSPAIRRVLGYEPDEVIGRRAAEVFTPEDGEQVAALASEALRHPREPLRTGPIGLRTREGVLRQIEATITNLIDQPVVSGIVVNAYDVTERERAAHNQRELQLQLFESQ